MMRPDLLIVTRRPKQLDDLLRWHYACHPLVDGMSEQAAREILPRIRAITASGAFSAAIDPEANLDRSSKAKTSCNSWYQNN